MEIIIENRTMDFTGYRQKLIEAMLDFNDLVGCPFVFVLGNGNVIDGFTVRTDELEKDGTVAALHRFVYDGIK